MTPARPGGPPGIEEVLEVVGLKKHDLQSGAMVVSPGQLEAIVDFARNLGVEEERRRKNLHLSYFQQLMNLLPDFVYFKDLQSRFIFINQAHCHHLGLEEPEDAIGKSDFDFFQEAFAQAKYRDEQEIIRTGRGWYFKEEHQVHSSGEEQWALSTKLPLHDENGEISGTFGLSRNITDKKLNEMEIERQRSLLGAIVEVLPCRLFVRDLEGRYLLVNEEYRKQLGLATREELEGKRLSDYKQGELVRQIEEEDQRLMDSGDPLKNQIRYNGSPLQDDRWILTSKVPLKTGQGDIAGLVGMTLDVSEQKQAEQRARIAQNALLQKNQQMEAELLVARQLQERLLSTGFNKDGSYVAVSDAWKLRAQYFYEPSHHLAGDFFFLMPIAENKVGVIICDVMGHGVKAAMVTMLIRGLMLEVPQILENPVEVLEFLNEKLFSLTRESYFPRFITATYLVIDLAEGKVEIADAGHPIPLMYEAREMQGGSSEVRPIPLDFMGSALGLQADSEFQGSSIQLVGRTNLFLFTDGLVESENRDGEEYGLERLKQSLNRHAHGNPAETVTAVSRGVDAFTGKGELDDDVCMVAIQLSPQS